MADENKGQEPGSPSGKKTTTGQEPAAASPGGELSPTEQIIAALEAEEAAASVEKGKPEKKEATPDDKKEKPLPYDQDPKWKQARAAEKRLTDILEKHGFDSADELEVALGQGLSLQDVLGNRDAKKLIADAEYLQEVKEYWAKQERIKQEENEDPEETAARLKKELAERDKRDADAKASAEEEKSRKEALSNYETAIAKAVDSEGFDEKGAEFVKMMMGIKNPFFEIDINDRKAVKAMASEQAKGFKKFIADVRQQAVDDYAKGKSEIVPISSAETPSRESVKKKEIPKDASVERAFSIASQEIIDLLNAQAM